MVAVLQAGEYGILIAEPSGVENCFFAVALLAGESWFFAVALPAVENWFFAVVLQAGESWFFAVELQAVENLISVAASTVEGNSVLVAEEPACCSADSVVGADKDNIRLS